MVIWCKSHMNKGEVTCIIQIIGWGFVEQDNKHYDVKGFTFKRHLGSQDMGMGPQTTGDTNW